MKLILASNSPRRKELLANFGFKFDIITSEFKETDCFTPPEETVKAFALGKAMDVYKKTAGQRVVLGADTIVVLDGKILGKPKSPADAVDTLISLSAKTHEVLTGYAIVSSNGNADVGFVKTLVTFNDLPLDLINEYVNSGLPLDKAGSYGIQDGYNLVKKYDGSLNNVIGLPIEIIKDKLTKLLK